MNKFLLICSALICFGSAYAKEYTLVFNDYPPFEYSSPAGAKGLSVDRIKKIFGNLGHSVKFMPVPWTRALKMSKAHKVDGIFSLFKTKEREVFFTYPKYPLFRSKDILVSNAKSKVSIKSFNDLKKYKIGVVKDNSHGAKFDSMKLDKDFSVSTEIALLRKVEAGRLDVAVITEQVFYHYLNTLKMKRSDFKIQPLVVNSEDLYLALSNKIPNVKKLVQGLSKELKTLTK